MARGNDGIRLEQVAQQQALVQEKQNMLGELLFKTRDIVKESTPISRILVMIYMDVSDMFERIMTSYQNYETLHKHFDDLNILQHFNLLYQNLKSFKNCHVCFLVCLFKI